MSRVLEFWSESNRRPWNGQSCTLTNLASFASSRIKPVQCPALSHLIWRRPCPNPILFPPIWRPPSPCPTCHTYSNLSQPVPFGCTTCPFPNFRNSMRTPSALSPKFDLDPFGNLIRTLLVFWLGNPLHLAKSTDFQRVVQAECLYHMVCYDMQTVQARCLYQTCPTGARKHQKRSVPCPRDRSLAYTHAEGLSLSQGQTLYPRWILSQSNLSRAQSVS